MDRLKCLKMVGPMVGAVLALSAPLAAVAAEQSSGPRMMDRGGPGYGYGPGHGMGMMGGYGPGYGMGPGMMGGYGMGPGMMGGYGMMGGMGPGMMGGYGMGPGMMGGYGMGYGRMGGLWGLDLKDDQVDKIDKIRDELSKKQRGLMQQMWEQQDKLRELYYADKIDRAAIDKVNAKLGELHRQAFGAHLDAEKKMEDVLTKEQREQLRRGARRWGMMGY